jgi:hypothetical protein
VCKEHRRKLLYAKNTSLFLGDASSQAQLFLLLHHHRTTQLPRDLASATFVDGCLALRAHAAVLRVFRVSQRLNQVRIAR